MSQILVRDLAPETVDQLKERAARNRRSLQQEVRIILEEAARRTEIEAARESERCRRIEEFLKFANEAAARAGPQTSDSVDLIREDRDR